MKTSVLRPLVAGLVVLVLVAAALVGGLVLAQPAESITAPTAPLVTVPGAVIAPTVVDATTAPADGDQLSETDPLSAIVGTVDVVAEPAEGISPETVALFEAMTEADDPLDPLAPGGDRAPAAEDYGVSLFGADDPCATDAASEGCPDGGVASTVLALYGSEPLEIRALVNPPSYATAPHSPVVCDQGEQSRTAVTLGVATNKPTTLTIRYWPADSPGYGPDTLSIDVPLDPVEEADWDAHSGDRATSLQAYWVQHCVRIEGLLRDTRYVAAIWASERDGGASRTERYSFSSNGGERPATEVIPSGNGMLYVTSYHERDVETAITARLLELAEPADCTVPDDGSLDRVYGPELSRVDQSWLRENNYGDQFDSRTSVGYYVPEGSYLVVCVTQSRADSPSWLDDNPLRAERFLISAPDRTIPVVSVRGVLPRAGSNPDYVVITASTLEGQLCGGASSPSGGGDYDYHDFTNAVLCDFSSATGARLGSDGNLAITTNAMGGGDSNRGTYVLDLASEVCHGDCPVLPAPSNYSVVLGSPSSPLGRVFLRVDWEQGRQNGATTWEIDALSGHILPDILPDRPRLDTSQRLQAIEYLYGLPLDSVGVWTTLVPDRPVDYVATLIGDCTVPLGGEFPVATTTRLEGSTSGPVQLQFSNVCFGKTYGLEVTMTDASGATTTYSSEPGADERWRTARVTTPKLRVSVAYGFTIKARPSTSDVWRLDSVQMWVDGAFTRELVTVPTCFGGRSFDSGEYDVPMDFATNSHIVLRVTASRAEGSNRVNADGTVTTTCGETLDAGPLVQSIELTLDTVIFHTDPYPSSYTIAGTTRFDVTYNLKRIAH